MPLVWDWIWVGINVLNIDVTVFKSFILSTTTTNYGGP